MKRCISLLLAVLMVLSLAACGSQSDTPANTESTASTQESAATSAETSSAAVTNEYGWEVPKETIKIDYYAGYNSDPADADEKSEVAKQFFKDKFNVEINRQLYAVDVTERLNLMLAGNDYPEVITWMPDDMAEKFIAQGRALELTSLVEQYGSNITRRMGKYLNLLKTDDGKLYKLAVSWGATPDVAGYDFAVRYDWFLETGLPIYKTFDEYYSTLKTIVANHPTNANGEKVYAISDNSDNKTNGTLLRDTMLAAYGFKNGFKVNESTGEFTHWLNTPEGLQMAKYINRFVREGLMDPDFLTNKFDTWKTKAINERFAGNIGLWWHAWVGGQEAWAEKEKENFNINKRYINVTLKGEGVENHTNLKSNFIGGYRVIITDKCQQPENIMKWFNWECSELGTFITANGQPDPENVWDIVDGKWIFKDSAKDYNSKNVNFHQVREKFGAQSFMMATSGGLLEDERIDPTVKNVSTWDMWPIDEKGGFKEPGINLSWQYTDGKSWDATLFNVSYPGDDPIAITNQTIKDLLVSEWAKIITSKTEADVEANFKAASEKINKLGLKDLEKYNSDYYIKNKAKMEK